MKPRCPKCNSALVWSDHQGTRPTACTECGWVREHDIHDVTPLELPYILQKADSIMIEALKKSSNQDIAKIASAFFQGMCANPSPYITHAAAFRKARSFCIENAESWSNSTLIAEGDAANADEMVIAWLACADEIITHLNIQLAKS